MPITRWDAALIALKAMTYGATLAAAGATFFLRYCDSLMMNADRLRIRHVVRASAVLALIAGGAQLAVTAGSMGEDAASMFNGSLLRMVWHAGQGRAFGIRALGLVLASVCAWSLRRPSSPAIAGAVLAASSFAWVGHGHSLLPNVLPTVLIAAHLLGVAFWLGALLPLLIISQHNDPPSIAALAGRFSALAAAVVAILVAAGVGLLWFLLGTFAALWGSAYGRLVSLKLFLVAGLLCCAAVNKWRLTPRLRSDDRDAVRDLRSSIRLEMLVAGLILAVTAVFTSVTGPPVLD